MTIKKQYIIFLGEEAIKDINQFEQLLPRYLKTYGKVYCFEYPRFKTFFQLITGKTKLLQKYNPSLYVYHSFALLPKGRSNLVVNKINHLINIFIFNLFILKSIKYSSIITFTPEIYLIKKYLLKHNKIYYYVTDNYTSLPQWNSRKKKKQFQYLEKKLLKMVSKVITVSFPLFQKYKKFFPNTTYFPIPFIANTYRQTKTIPTQLTSLPKPIIGFVGTFLDWKIDFDLFIRLLEEFPIASFVLIGPVNIASAKKIIQLNKFSNIHFISTKPQSLLYSYISQFDVCIIPYKTNHWGKYAYPVKIFEYLILGKPIVTTSLPAIKKVNDRKLIYLSRNKNEFLKNVKKALDEKKDNEIIKKRIEYAKKHSWTNQIKSIIKILNE